MTEQKELDDLDRWVAVLQQAIIERQQAIYSARVLEEARNPKNVGRMDNPDAQATLRGWCGDTMEIYLRLDGEWIQEASFMTDGCGPTIACGSALTSMVQSLTVDEAAEIMPKDLLAALDGLPEENEHCADLAVYTLQEALADL
jgi:nitrogen fixation NifU-like protein